jgi:molybdopterin converting factor small subunit
LRVTIKMLAKGSAPAREFEVECPGATLADLRRQLAEKYGGIFAKDMPLLGFLNGKSAGRDWERVALNDGDTIMFVAPIGGG